VLSRFRVRRKVTWRVLCHIVLAMLRLRKTARHGQLMPG
jgi:hypothetical protein